MNKTTSVINTPESLLTDTNLTVDINGGSINSSKSHFQQSPKVVCVVKPVNSQENVMKTLLLPQSEIGTMPKRNNTHEEDSISEIYSNLPSRLPSIALNNKKSDTISLASENNSVKWNEKSSELIVSNPCPKNDSIDFEKNGQQFDAHLTHPNEIQQEITAPSDTDVLIDMEMSEEMTSRRNRKRVNDDDNATHFSMTHSEDVMAFEGAYDTPILANTPLIFKSNFYPPDKSCKSKDEDKKSSSFRAFLSSIHGDENSLALLLVLYFLQGIPLGIMGCIPLILSENKASLADQSFFSFSSYPFSAKLLWAPIVDSIWIRKIGRRKTWLLPTQFLISLYLFGLSYSINDLLPHSETTNIAASIKILTFVFLPLNFLAATQDIAVDGWALTMLSRKNVGYASTCNVIGQHAGVFFGHNVFLFLSSEKYTNRFFRSTKGTGGLIEFSGFLLFWCAIFFITTTLVFLFKKEVDNSKSPSNDNHKKNDLPIESSDIKGNNTSLMNPDHHVDNDDEMELGIGETYSTLWKIILLKPMAMLLFVMFTNKFAFSAASSTTFLKLIEIGVDKEDISMLNVFLSPLAFVLPIFIGKFTVGQSPLNCFLYAYPLRLLINGLYSGLVYVSPWFQDADGSYPYHFYGIWLGAMLLHDSLSIVMFLSIMAFFAKISDPKIGGTYMTMLNTISNLGGMISGTVTMRFMDFVTYKNCYTKDTFEFVSVCNNKADALTCKTSGNSCQTDVDGYFITVAVGTVYGVIWLIFLWNRIKRFQHIPQSEWLVFKKNN